MGSLPSWVSQPSVSNESHLEILLRCGWTQASDPTLQTRYWEMLLVPALGSFSVTLGLHQELAIFFFSKGSESECIRPCESYSLCHNYSDLVLSCESIHRLCINEWVCLCPNKTLFTKTRGRWDLASGS